MEVRTVTVQLGGGRRLILSRFNDPDTGRDVVTLAEGWPGEPPQPGRQGESIELSASLLPEIVEALRGLEERD